MIEDINEIVLDLDELKDNYKEATKEMPEETERFLQEIKRACKDCARHGWTSCDFYIQLGTPNSEKEQICTVIESWGLKVRVYKGIYVDEGGRPSILISVYGWGEEEPVLQ